MLLSHFLTLNILLEKNIRIKIDPLPLIGIFLLVSLVIAALIFYIYHIIIVKRKINSTRNELLNSFDHDKSILSKELHDVVGSFLIPLREESEKMSDKERLLWEERINTFEKFIKQTSKTIYPEYIYEGNLFDAINKLSGFLTTESTEVLSHTSEKVELDSKVGLQSFKIALELLTNIIKHDKPNKVVIATLIENQNLLIVINYTSSNSGDISFKSNEESMGLQIIDQRLLSVKGKLSRSNDHGNTQINLTIPI